MGIGLQKKPPHGGAGRARERRKQGPGGILWAGGTQIASSPSSPSRLGPSPSWGKSPRRGGRSGSRLCHFPAWAAWPEAPSLPEPASRPTSFGRIRRSGNVSFLPASRPRLVFPPSLLSSLVRPFSSRLRNLSQTAAFSNRARPPGARAASPQPRPTPRPARRPRAARSASLVPAQPRRPDPSPGREDGARRDALARAVPGWPRAQGGAAGSAAGGRKRQPDRSPRARLQIAAVSNPCPASLPAFRTFGIFSSFFLPSSPLPGGPFLQPPPFPCTHHTPSHAASRGQETSAEVQGPRSRIITKTKLGLIEHILCALTEPFKGGHR